MGVPVVARSGDTAMWRMSAATLVAAGLETWVAPSDPAFVAIAAGLAADLERLAATRAALRARIVASPLCDGPAFARSMEHLWRDVWRRWCVSSAAAAGWAG
jgi:predicted O-linked N-acetylglucosamine transferase (SPINDLY family)